MTETFALSIRARQALGAAAVESFCSRAHIYDASVDLFIAHLWSIVCARDIPRWEEEGRNLAITGQGDPLPAQLAAKIGSDAADRLARALQFAHEISMSQIFGAFQPAQSDKFLTQALVEAGIECRRVEVPAILARHVGGTDGWGVAVAQEDLSRWQTAAREYVGLQK